MKRLDLTIYQLTEVKKIIQGLQRLLKKGKNTNPDELVGSEHFTIEQREEISQDLDLPYWLFVKMAIYAKSQSDLLRNRRLFLALYHNIIPKDNREAWQEAVWLNVAKDLMETDIDDGWKSGHLITVPWVRMEKHEAVMSISLIKINCYITIFDNEQKRLKESVKNNDINQICTHCQDRTALPDGSLCYSCYQDLAQKGKPEGFIFFDNPCKQRIRVYQHIGRLSGIPIHIDDQMIDMDGQPTKRLKHRIFIPEEKIDDINNIILALDEESKQYDKCWNTGIPVKLIKEVIPKLKL